MFDLDLIHVMCTRVIASPAFDGSQILAAILFEQTMQRSVQGVPTAQYLWEEKQIVPFRKVDKGLAGEQLHERYAVWSIAVTVSRTSDNSRLSPTAGRWPSRAMT